MIAATVANSKTVRTKGLARVSRRWPDGYPVRRRKGAQPGDGTGQGLRRVRDRARPIGAGHSGANERHAWEAPPNRRSWLLTAGNQAAFYMPSRAANTFGVGGAAASVECRFFIATPGARSSIRVQLIAVTERKRWRDVHSWKQRHHGSTSTSFPALDSGLSPPAAASISSTTTRSWEPAARAAAAQLANLAVRVLRAPAERQYVRRSR
jgi:hypothetical protein